MSLEVHFFAVLCKTTTRNFGFVVISNLSLYRSICTVLVWQQIQLRDSFDTDKQSM